MTPTQRNKLLSFTLIGLADSAERRSPERALVQAAIDLAATRFALTAAVFDLSNIGPLLMNGAKFEDLSYFSRAAIKAIRSADALILGGAVGTGAFSPRF